MNNKAMTIIAAAAVVIAAFAGLSAVQGVDADSEAISSLQLGTSDVTIVPGGDSASILLKVSEAEYVPLGYKLTWYVASATGSSGSYSAEFNTDQSLGSRDVIGSTDISQVAKFQPKADGVTISSTTFTMKETDDLGNYILDVKCSSGAPSYNYAIKCVVEVDVITDNEQGMSVPPVYGIVATTIGSESTPTALNPMGFVIGVPSMAAVSSGSGEILATGKTWYATGLPPGLSMSPSGIVSGMPTGKDSAGNNLAFSNGSASVDVRVYSSEIEDGDVKITEYTLTVSINERAPSAMTLTLSSEASSGFQTIQMNSIYSAVQGTEVKLNVFVNEGSTLDVVAVTVIAKNGEFRITYSESDGAVVPTAGVGQYHIFVNAVVDGTPITGHVTLNVVSALDSLENSIVIDGA